MILQTMHSATLMVVTVVDWKYKKDLVLNVCEKSNWIGDGYCDDFTNTPDCNFDGGDCCGTNVNVEFCTDCTCH